MAGDAAVEETKVDAAVEETKDDAAVKETKVEATKEEVVVAEVPEKEAIIENGAKSQGKEVPETISTEENGVSPLEENVIRQIEYYFGDMNLPRDKFLKEQIQLDDGWIPLATMFNFKRLSNFTKDPEVVIAALAKSVSQLMEVSEDKTKLRRSPEYPLPELNEERRKELMTRTVYVKGFPKDDLSIDFCLEFFKKYGTSPEDIILRRYLEKISKKWLFKGSIFATFKTVDQATEFLKEPSMKIGEVEAVRKWQAKYLEEKRAETDERQKKNAAKKEKKQQKEEYQKSTIKLPTGTVLMLSEVPEDVTRDSIKEAVTALGGNVAFIKVEDGKAWIRLQVEDTAKEVFEKCTDSKLKVEDNNLEVSLLQGEEEQKFLDEMAGELMKRRQKQNKGPRSGGKQHYNRKRRGGGDSGPPSKRR